MSDEHLESLKKLAVEDVRAAREYERLTGQSAAEWVELSRREIDKPADAEER